MTARKTESDKNTFSDKPKLAALRDGFSEGILKLGEENKNVVLLCADVAESTRSHFFKEKFPERFFEMDKGSGAEGRPPADSSEHEEMD